MRSYILLRNNRESGPYSLRELKTIGISSTDLIWIEGESTAWCDPQEFEELQALVQTGILIPLQTPSPPAFRPEESPSSYTFNDDVDKSIGTAAHGADYSQYLEGKEENFHWEPKKSRQLLREATSSFFGLGVLLIGVMMCAFVVQKLVDHFEFEPQVASSQAIEISRESLPVSTSANAAKTVAQTTTAPVVLPEATTAEPQTLVAAAMSKPIEVKKKASVDTPKTTRSAVDDGVVKTESPEQNEPEPKPEEEKKDVPVEKKAPSLEISANDYKVGMFGGISNLELSISNPSSVPVSKATVEVEFLKPNGSVAKSEILSVENISAGGAKKLTVPSSGRGVKVRYRVVSVDVQ